MATKIPKTDPGDVSPPCDKLPSGTRVMLSSVARMLAGHMDPLRNRSDSEAFGQLIMLHCYSFGALVGSMMARGNTPDPAEAEAINQVADNLCAAFRKGYTAALYGGSDEPQH